ncbi:MAG: hypothetical protein JJU10_06675 [Idiomarina sp.]|nr:hypothetical protein [Idiomarina sp.]
MNATNQLTQPAYTGLLNTLARASIAALLIDGQGRVTQWNACCKPRYPERSEKCWADFCFHAKSRFPEHGSAAILLSEQEHVRAGYVIITRLLEQPPGILLVMHVEQLWADNDRLGFVIYHAETQRCFWSAHAAELHEEGEEQSRFHVREFLQWYEPAQRDRLLYAMMACEETQQPQQVSLRIAHSGKRIRYLWLTLPVNGKPLTCGFIRALQPYPAHHRPHLNHSQAIAG